MSLVGYTSLYLTIIPALISIGCKEINKNEDISSSNESIQINNKLDTTITNISENTFCPLKLEFKLGEELNLDLSSRDDIVVKVINKNTKEIISESNKAWGKYIIGDSGKFGRGDLIKPGTYSVEVNKEELYNFKLEDVFVHFEIYKDGNNIYSYTYPEKYIKVNIRQVQPEANEFGRLYKFILNNNTVNVSNIEVIASGKGQDNEYKELYKASLVINPNEEKVITIPSNTGIIDLKVITRCDYLYNEQSLKIDESFIKMGENGHIDIISIAPNYEDVGLKYRWEISNLNNLYNEQSLKIDESFIKMGENGHIDIISIAPNYEDVGLKYRWEISNLNNSNNSNIKITTLDNKEELANLTINPKDTVFIETLVEKGNTINVHTMQGDGSYIYRKISVDEEMIKFKDVDVKNIDVDVNNYGRMLRWSVKNTNSSGKANVIVRDGAGNIISQFDLNYNQVNEFDIDVNRGRCIIVETRMGNGKYSSKKYSIVNNNEKENIKISKLEVLDNKVVRYEGRCIIVETRMGNGKYSSKKYSIVNNNEKENIKISKLEVLDNKVVRYELENTLNHKTNVILVTEDDLTVISSFDLNVGEKIIIDINSNYVTKFRVKTLQHDGSYSEQLIEI